MMNKEKLIWTFFGVLVVLISVYFTIKRDIKMNGLILNKGFCVGEIIKYTEVGVGNGYYVLYEYYVDNVRYEYEINHNMKRCIYDNSCVGKYFLVIYNKDNPELSEMNFNLQIECP